MPINYYTKIRKMNMITLSAGAIILWKDYGRCRRMWAKLINRPLKFNSFLICEDGSSIITSGIITDSAVV